MMTDPEIITASPVGEKSGMEPENLRCVFAKKCICILRPVLSPPETAAVFAGGHAGGAAEHDAKG